MSKQRGVLDQSALRVEPLYDVFGNPLIGPEKQSGAVEKGRAFTATQLEAKREEDPFVQTDLERGSVSQRRRV